MSEIIVKAMDGIRADVETLKSEQKTRIEEIMKAAEAANAKAKEAVDEAAKHGSSYGETAAKVKEITGKMADWTGDLQKAHQAIEKLTADLKLKGGMGHNGGPDMSEEITKSAKSFYRAKHFGEQADSDAGLADFEDRNVTQDMIKAYSDANKLFWTKGIRSLRPNGVGDHWMSTEEAKALAPLHIQKNISTMTHGNRFWMTNEFSDRIISCYDDVSDPSHLFTSMWTSRPGLEMMVENDVNDRALFRCEIVTNPANNPAPAQPGTIGIPVHEMYDKQCITHQMLDDAEIDLEGWLLPKVALGFQRGRNHMFFWGNGNGQPTGLMRPGKHVELPLTTIAGSAAGQITWQHLTTLPFMLPKRFQATGSYMISRDALMSLFTMADGDGKPMMLSGNQIAVGPDGMMRLWGYPVHQVDQMQNYLSPTAVPVVGAKPVGFGSWHDAYTIVNRLGFYVLRDPAYNVNGVIWHFGQRVGGDVTCPNASVFLKIA